MKTLFASTALVIGLMASTGAFAKANEMAAPAGTPAGTTGVCNDGSLNTTPTKTGACQGHKGIKVWYTTSATATTPATPATKTTTTATATTPVTTPTAAPAKKGLMSIFSKKPAPATTAAATATAATTTPVTTTKTTAAPAAGGGAGQVWVNTASKVYHCPGSQYYGKTKAGQYMTEAAAKAAGDRPDHGKACS